MKSLLLFLSLGLCLVGMLLLHSRPVTTPRTVLAPAADGHAFERPSLASIRPMVEAPR